MLSKLNVVVLDGFTLNDIPWKGYDQFASFTLYDVTDPGQIVERCKDADVILTNKVTIGEAEFMALHRLSYIGVLATGYDNISLNAAKRHGVVVTNVPVYANYSVAQLVFGLLMELCYHVALHHKTIVVDKKWSGYHINSYWEMPLIELYGKTMGVIGMGKIGERVGIIAEAFGMKVIAQDAFERPIDTIRDFQWVSLDELLARSDVVSIHCPLFPETRGMMNRDAFSKMKPNAFFINTSRGPLVVEEDLRWALDNGVIAGAGLDVLSSEPPAYDNPMFEAKNCVLTSHIGWATVEARGRLVEIALQNIIAKFAGNPANVVNG